MGMRSNAIWICSPLGSFALSSGGLSIRKLQSQDLSQHLAEQISFLRASAAAFDDGVEAEAKRLAVQIRVLVYDAQGSRRNRSVSLLTQLGVRDHLPWIDTAIAPDPSWEHDFSCGLCRLEGVGKGPSMVMRYAAPLDDLGPDRRHPPAAFVDWWTEPVLADREGHSFSRGDFIDRVANQDGGAHIDSSLERSYEALTRGNSMRILSGKGMLGFNIGVSLPDDGPGPPESGIALASIRQITFEVLESLKRGLETNPSGDVSLRSPICSLPIASEVEVGRNDPCPCGSGRKLKKCFGLRMPRNPRATLSASISMA
jgi:hypothetical protein